jgi:hypothetical protein
MWSLIIITRRSAAAVSEIDLTVTVVVDAVRARREVSGAGNSRYPGLAVLWICALNGEVCSVKSEVLIIAWGVKVTLAVRVPSAALSISAGGAYIRPVS